MVCTPSTLLSSLQRDTYRGLDFTIIHKAAIIRPRGCMRMQVQGRQAAREDLNSFGAQSWKCLMLYTTERYGESMSRLIMTAKVELSRWNLDTLYAVRVLLSCYLDGAPNHSSLRFSLLTSFIP